VDEVGAVNVVRGQIKKREESIQQFEAAGRKDLAEAEKQEISWLNAYLPQEYPEFELAAAVDAAIAELNAKSAKELGAVIAKSVQGLDQTRINKKVVADLAKTRLSPKK
jgi:uncharacterized protein YqeY